MRWLDVIGNVVRRNTSGFMAVMAGVALVGTVFGLGATGQAPDVLDGKSWLWSRGDGVVMRVSSGSGQVDLRQPVVDSRGHHIKVTQSDQYLFLHDLDTGRITSVDLTRMGFSGSLAVGTTDDVAMALSGSVAAVVNRSRGLIRVIDPATLQVKGEPLQLPAPLVGGSAFDGSGVLWVGLPTQGTVVGLSLQDGAVAVRSTVPVAPPGHELAISVLDNGVLAVDRGGSDIVAVVGDDVHRMTAPVPLTGALLPERTVGPLAALTVPAAQAVVTIADVGKGGPIGRLPLSKKDGVEVAVPFAGRIYVPDNDNHTVQVYSVDGRSLSTITIPAAEGELELEVREQHLFINAPDSSVASIIDEGGGTQIIDKREPVRTLPSQSGSVSAPPSVTVSRPGNGGPTGKPTTANPPTSDVGGGQTRTPPPATPPPASLTPPPTTPPPTTPPPTTPPPVPQPPGPPIPVTAFAGDGKVTLTWGIAASDDAPVTSYIVTWDGGSSTVAGDTRQTVVGGLTNGKEYRFRVAAVNRYGQGAPALSGPVTPVDGTPPDRPAKPTAVAKGGNVTVTWPAVNDAREYVVTPLRAGVAGADPVQRVSGTSTEFSGLKLGTSYTFTVVAVDAEGRSSATSPPSNAVVPVGAPNVTISSISSTATAVTVKFTVDNGGATASCAISIAPSGRRRPGAAAPPPSPG
ncbi:hypothetical protein GCM10027610_091410 [Dactylosporangium cerinum]